MGWNINCSTNANALVNIRVILVHTISLVYTPYSVLCTTPYPHRLCLSPQPSPVIHGYATLMQSIVKAKPIVSPIKYVHIPPAFYLLHPSWGKKQSLDSPGFSPARSCILVNLTELKSDRIAD